MQNRKRGKVMKKKLLSVILAAMMVCSLAACGSSSDTKKEEPATEDAAPETEVAAPETEEAVSAEEAIRVACVYSSLLGDKSYSDSCHAGLMKAKEDFNIEVKELEGTTADEWEANFLAACEDGYDLVIGSSANFEEYMKKYCASYPDIKFAIIDTTVEGDNVQSISFAQNQGSFLAGAAAAMFTQYDEIDGVNEDHIIGWVGGMDIPVIHDFYVGYEQGAKYVDPDVQILQSFAGTFNDPLKGKELALAQFDQGADIVMNVASGTGLGVLEAAKDSGHYAIGVDLNQDNEQPGSVLTSMLKRVDTACYMTVQSVVDGTFEGGSTAYLTVAESGVSLTDFSVIKEALGDKFPDEILDKVDELAEKISAGEIVVENYEGFGPQK